VNPGGGAGWDEPPLDIQIPDDARELDRDVLAYHRELRAMRRRNRLRRLAGPLAGHGTLMPLLASIFAVCLVAGAMLSVATFSPATAPAAPTQSRTATAASSVPGVPQTGPSRSAATQPATAGAGTAGAGIAQPGARHSARAQASRTTKATSSARPSGAATQPGSSARATGSSSP
jgi:hypothetical protein